MSEDKPIYVNLKITKEEHPELYEFLRDTQMPTKWAVETALYRFMNEAKGVLSREPAQGGQAATVAPAQPIQQQPQQPPRPMANTKKLFGFND